MSNTVTLRVRADSAAKKVAGSISHALKEGNAKSVEILAIGAGAVNQTVKAIAISSRHLATHAEVLNTRIGFKDTEIDGETKTVMRFVCEIM